MAQEEREKREIKMPETSRDVVVVLLDDTTFTVPVKVRLLVIIHYLTLETN